jgi:serpin B
LSQQELHPAFAALEAGLAGVQKKGKVKLSIANSLWPQKGYAFLPDYLDLCKKNYGTTITPLDYAKATEPARKTINTWVEDKTNKKITNLIGPGVLNESTRLVLVNAIYFKGDWSSQFKAEATQKQPFHLSAGKTVESPLMHQEREFGYRENDELQVLELPYAGNDLSMIVLLPRKANGLADLEAKLTVQNLAAWTGKLHRQKVEVFLPKFKMTSQFSLNDKLTVLGMTDAFTDKADFSGMNGNNNLYISAVIHKAFVEVNEQGTEAAAATAVVMATKSMPQPAPVFRADHPFLFLIRDNASGSILFLGRIVDPTK